MIKLTFCLTRLGHLSHDEFSKYWLQVHGPLVKSVMKQLGILRYVQNHSLCNEELFQFVREPRGVIDDPYDGIAELWFSSSLSSSSSSDAERQAAGRMLLEDEKKFIDLEKSPLWYNYEVDIIPRQRMTNLNEGQGNVDGSSDGRAIKMTFCLRRSGNVSKEEFHNYWRNVHGPKVKSVTETLRIKKYSQTHSLHRQDMCDRVQKPRGTKTLAYEGIAELWWDNIEDLLAIGENENAPMAGAMLLEDERKFIDLQHSPIWYNYEYEIISVEESSPNNSSKL